MMRCVGVVLIASLCMACGHAGTVWKVVRSACGVVLAISPDRDVVGPGTIEELPEEAALQVASESAEFLNRGSAE